MNMEDFVKYEQALALKKLGFNENTFYHYNSEKQLRANFSINENSFEGYFLRNNTDFSYSISAPTLAQAQKWLRNIKGIDIDVNVLHEKGERYYEDNVYHIYTDSGHIIHGDKWKSYEEALSEGITECIELLENKAEEI